MKFLKFALHKRYFDTGMGTLNYLKYVLVAFGFSSLNVKATMLLALAFAVVSYFVGWWWLNYGMVNAETEISNLYNPFVKEMREKFGIPKSI